MFNNQRHISNNNKQVLVLGDFEPLVSAKRRKCLRIPLMVKEHGHLLVKRMNFFFVLFFSLVT